MKTTLTTLTLFASIALGAHAQTSTPPVKDDLFAGTEKFAQNATSVTQIDMDPESLGMVEGSNSTRARRTVLNVVHTYAYDKPGQYNIADVDIFRNKLNTGDWHCSIHTYEQKSGSSTDVCNKHRTDGMEEKAIITVSPRELTFIHTIRRTGTSGSSGASSWGNSSQVFYPLIPSDLGSWNEPGQTALFQAQMLESSIEMQARIQAQMAELRADTAGLPGNFAFGTSIFRDGPQNITLKIQHDPKIKLPEYLDLQTTGAPSSAPQAPARP